MDPEILDVEDVAEATTEESSTSPEASTAKDGESAAEQSDKEKPDGQESPKPDEADDSKLPFHNHPRWKEVYGDNKEMRVTLDELSELGIRSKADAENLLRDADETEREAEEKGVNNLAKFILEDELRFNNELWDKHPEYAARYDGMVISAHLAREAERVSSSKPELAAELRRIAQAVTPQGKGKSQARENSNSDLQSIHDEKQSGFEEQVSNSVSTAFKDEVDKQIKGYVFAEGEEQKTRFFENVFQAVNRSLLNNPVFLRAEARLKDVRGVRGEALRQRRSQLVDLYRDYALDSRTLKSAIDREKRLMGIRMGASKTPTNGTRDVMATGSQSTGKMTQEQEDRDWEELSKKYEGPELTRQLARRLSAAKSRAS